MSLKQITEQDRKWFEFLFHNSEYANLQLNEKETAYKFVKNQFENMQILNLSSFLENVIVYHGKNLISDSCNSHDAFDTKFSESSEIKKVSTILRKDPSRVNLKITANFRISSHKRGFLRIVMLNDFKNEFRFFVIPEKFWLNKKTIDIRIHNAHKYYGYSARHPDNLDTMDWWNFEVLNLFDLSNLRIPEKGKKDAEFRLSHNELYWYSDKYHISENWENLYRSIE